ncbi:MAG: bifunctional 5,10-methylenetetrahydrofolate dehydrogenase/5,10-methenyltetrahydrofolate cyclohydrolase [Candidatus Aminicenantes bacterium]
MGTWLEGKTLARRIKDKVKEEVSRYSHTHKQVPGLVGILVGENKDSKIYLRTKEKNCRRLGIHSEILHFPATTEASVLKSRIEVLNKREDVDGILIQLPLPSPLDPYEMITTILPEKDVDGIHPYNIGNLMMNREGMRPCTPTGIVELLKDRNISIEGKRVVVMGRSLIVGKPLAAMMTNENGTVTICHSRTKNLWQVAAEADILVTAMGKAAYVTDEFIKEGATVVDVGMNYLTDRVKAESLFGKDEKRLTDIEEKGYTWIGDVHPGVFKKTEYLTPVPGGVGPLTVAILMRNTLDAFKRRRNL